ncbi:HAD family acid phosphatase [Kitasatospora sp. NPDC048540]|uniref:HAD family acid phosphatase n=1 Tax=unclassified Kitasatospora TaxID=2633591 RepID=UPI000A63A6F0|nr:HAD family acid phosphatase [Kitasatospora sp. MBT63]
MTAPLRRTRALGTVAVIGTAVALAAATPAGAAQPAKAPEAVPAVAPAVAAAPALGKPNVPYATWLKDVQAVADQADSYLRTRVPAKAGEHPAIVLDIDNTSLETDYNFGLPTPAVQAVLNVVKSANARGTKVFFVTARPGFIDCITRYNLTSVGYPVDGLYGRSFLDLFQETSAFKTAKRAEIEQSGYTIVANIGNNTTDLVGGHAERTFKLPDYGGQLS